MYGGSFESLRTGTYHPYRRPAQALPRDWPLQAPQQGREPAQAQTLQYARPGSPFGQMERMGLAQMAQTPRSLLSDSPEEQDAGRAAAHETMRWRYPPSTDFDSFFEDEENSAKDSGPYNLS
jgi:hypothetical protein